MKTIPTTISIVRGGGHPVFNCIKVGIDDEAAGTYLTIKDETESGNCETIRLDWQEWDAIVETVAKYREEWEKEW